MTRDCIFDRMRTSIVHIGSRRRHAPKRRRAELALARVPRSDSSKAFGRHIMQQKVAIRLDRLAARKRPGRNMAACAANLIEKHFSCFKVWCTPIRRRRCKRGHEERQIGKLFCADLRVSALILVLNVSENASGRNRDAKLIGHCVSSELGERRHVGLPTQSTKRATRQDMRSPEMPSASSSSGSANAMIASRSICSTKPSPKTEGVCRSSKYVASGSTAGRRATTACR